MRRKEGGAQRTKINDPMLALHIFQNYAHLGLASENTRFWIGGIASGKDDNCFGFVGLICCSLEHKASCVDFDNFRR